MKEYIGGGLGTPATRADIIEKLFSAFYMEKKGQFPGATSKGIQLIGLVPPDLKEPLLTAQWEQGAGGHQPGRGGQARLYRRNPGLRGFPGENRGCQRRGLYSRQHHPHPLPGVRQDDAGGQRKKGKMLVCQDRECGHRENLSMATNVRCPNCHKRMELFGNGDKKCYVCRCGFREKAEKFHQQSGSGGMSKREVQKYLSRQEEPKGQSALALALQKALAENGGDGEIREEKKGR